MTNEHRQAHAALVKAELSGKVARGFLRQGRETEAYTFMQDQLSHLARAEKALGRGIEQ